MYGLGLAVEGFRAEGLGLKHLNLGWDKASNKGDSRVLEDFLSTYGFVFRF